MRRRISLCSILIAASLLVVPACSALDDDDGDAGSVGGDGDGDGDVPGNAYCQSVADWDSNWNALENEVLSIVNQRRAQGANCGTSGMFGPASPLSMQGSLHCAARKHSQDMNVRNFFAHDNPDGEGPQPRIEKAGYTNWFTWGENIAAGSATAAATMDQWMGSDGHCANIMNPDFTEIGVGYTVGGEWGHLWTQVFGAR